MSEKIENVCKFQSEDTGKSYIYSLRKEEDSLGYDYYILTKNQDNQFINYRTDNTIKLLHDNGIELVRIKEDDPQYKEFLYELLEAMNNKPKKEEALSRK